MAKILRMMLWEFAIILMLWAGGWAIFFAGTVSLKAQKEHYWAHAIVGSSGYQKLSSQEQIKAYDQFMAIWAVKPGDRPFREGGLRFHLAYGAQLVGAWMKAGWIFLYMILALLRLAWRLRRPAMEKLAYSELRIFNIFLVLSGVWYIVWALVAPSAYSFYQRFVLGSYEYLWNARLEDFQMLARFWPVFLGVYVITAVARGFRRIFGGGNAR